MKSIELRIGNFITRKSSPDTICHVNWGIIKEFDRCEHHEYIPIPITEKLIKRLGIKLKYLHDTFPYFDFYASPATYRIYIDGGFAFLHYRADKNGWYPNLKKIKYVHQLQNIYYDLKGKELFKK